MIDLAHYVATFASSPLAAWSSARPWDITLQSDSIVRQLLGSIDASQYTITADIAIHHTATVEQGAALKGPLIVGPGCFIASHAYLRGGNWIAERCTIGPGAELKSSFVFAGTRLAHFNFVGDSILGADVNLEAGSIICNYRNERTPGDVRVRIGARMHETGCAKFGALIGDHVRIGANAVIAPGALLQRGAVVARAALLDQEVG